nr:hypothetical protein [Desulfobacula toluolica]
MGRVPELIDAGFQGEIICTHATKAIGKSPHLRQSWGYCTHICFCSWQYSIENMRRYHDPN